MAIQMIANIDELGRGKIFLDGKEISDHVCEVNITAKVGTPTKVSLTFVDCILADVTTMSDVYRQYKKFGIETPPADAFKYCPPS